MRRDWEPSPGGMPAYRIENRGQQTWLSTGPTFSGIVLVPSDTGWKRVHRGPGCTSVAPDPLLTPASSVISMEGYFRQPPSAFPPGLYRYQVELTLEQRKSGWFCYKGTPKFTTLTTYALTDEFWID